MILYKTFNSRVVVGLKKLDPKGQLQNLHPCPLVEEFMTKLNFFLNCKMKTF